MSVADSVEGLAASNAGRMPALWHLGLRQLLHGLLVGGGRVGDHGFWTSRCSRHHPGIEHSEAAKIQTLVAVPVVQAGTIVGPVTGVIYAGRALMADPALIENTSLGPLPRIADDGRKPMTV